MNEINTRAAMGDPLAMIDKVAVGIENLQRRERDLENQINHLRNLGWVDAKPHYRDGKYLYLIYPMVNGERRREYIGADQNKIQDALDAIERKSEIENLENRLADISSVISQTKYFLAKAIASAFSYDGDK